MAELDKLQYSLTDNQTLIIIPYQGCSNCVVKALDFLREHSEDERFAFAFLNYRSRKEIAIRMRSEKNLLDNVFYIERPEVFYSLGISHFYPTILNLKDNGLAIEIADINNINIWKSITEKE